MMIPNMYYLKSYKDRQLKSLALWLKARGFSANGITLIGLVLGLSAAFCMVKSLTSLGLILFGLSVGADLVDGTLARLEKGDRLSSKLWDAGCDRIVELLWIGSLVFTRIMNGWAWLLALGSISLLGCRWWAYRYGLDSSLVIFTRFERILALVGVAVFQGHRVAIFGYYLVTVGVFASCLQILSGIFKFHWTKANMANVKR